VRFVVHSVNRGTLSEAGIVVGFGCLLLGACFSLVAFSPSRMAGLFSRLPLISFGRRDLGGAVADQRESLDREQFQKMSIDELWDLHILVDAVLAARLVAKKAELERRLEQLRQKDVSDHSRG
jgi:hypothetical protein